MIITSTVRRAKVLATFARKGANRQHLLTVLEFTPMPHFSTVPN